MPDVGSAPALVIEGVSKRFGAFVALADIELRVYPGELVCFLGPSGCGKTTLLRIVAGLESQDTGRIVQNGADISYRPASRRDYGIVFQSYALFPNLTVAQNIAYGLVNRKTPKRDGNERVRELLALVRLPDAGSKFPSQLSGGQQQRIALARALATSPGLLLLDEPLSALDALERVRLRGEIRSLQQRLSVTTIMVTHDQEEALSMADRIVVMNRGRVEQIGTPQAVYAAPATAFVADFIGKVNVLDAVYRGAGVFETNGLSVNCSLVDASLASGERARIYLRPEDIVVANGSGYPADVIGRVEKVEYLGAYCMVSVMLPGAAAQTVTCNLSAAQVRDLELAAGKALALRFDGQRARVFPFTS